MPLKNVSAVVIVRNGDATIRDTLSSLKAFDEVVVYDNGSDDDTVNIARTFENVSLHQGEFSGFGKTKAHAVSLARNEWVFSIDADESVSDELRTSLLALSVDDPNTAYMVVMNNYIMGRSVRHSGWGNNWRLRLFNRTRHSFTEDAVHEKVALGAGGKLERLEGPLNHNSIRDLGQFLTRIDHYSELRRNSSVKTLPLPLIVGHTWFSFFRSYILQLGFLDGWRGTVIAQSMAMGTFFNHMKPLADRKVAREKSQREHRQSAAGNVNENNAQPGQGEMPGPAAPLNISGVIIVKNGEATLRNTLASMEDLAEVVVYDNGSDDGTLDIARSFENVSLHSGPFFGFGKTKSHAVSLANNDWVFSIDADESVTEELRDSMLALSLDDPNIAYTVIRRNFFMGRSVKHSGWGNDQLCRLFNRTRHNFNDAAVHEKVRLSDAGAEGQLSGYLDHEAVDNLGQFLTKQNQYSELRRGPTAKTSPALLILLRSWFAFIRVYFLKLGFLDGWRGIVLAQSRANATFFNHMKPLADRKVAEETGERNKKS